MNNTLIIEPYVDIVVGCNSILFYNTFTGDSYISAEPLIVELFSRDNSNLYSYSIKADMACNSQFQKFLCDISQKNMGKMLQNKGVNPVQFSIAHNLEFVTVSRNKTKHQILHMNVVDVAIYLNGKTSKHTYSNAYKQFLCCKNSDGQIELDNIVEYLAPLIEANSIVRIHLLGGNIFDYPHFASLLHYVETTFPNVRLFLHCNLIDLTERDISLINSSMHKFIVTVYPDDDVLQLQKFFEVKCECQFVVECESDLEKIEQLMLNHQDIQYSVVPYFNGQNIEFFKENVFTAVDDILQQTVSMNEIQKKRAINTTNFGRLIIDNNGDVYDNFNFPPISKIDSISIVQTVEKEIDDKMRWFTIRKMIEPCKNCIYRHLCPPISNLEFFMNQNNLCHAYQD